jgi:hypothetical protein
METERIELSARERERLKVLQQVEEGHLKQVEAARRLRLTGHFYFALAAFFGSEPSATAGSACHRQGPVERFGF